MDYEKEIARNNARAKKRREMGAREYGATSFLDKNNITEAIDEALDIVNYAHFAIIQLERIEKFLEEKLKSLTETKS